MASGQGRSGIRRDKQTNQKIIPLVSSAVVDGNNQKVNRVMGRDAGQLYGYVTAVLPDRRNGSLLLVVCRSSSCFACVLVSLLPLSAASLPRF